MGLFRKWIDLKNKPKCDIELPEERFYELNITEPKSTKEEIECVRDFIERESCKIVLREYMTKHEDCYNPKRIIESYENKILALKALKKIQEEFNSIVEK